MFLKAFNKLLRFPSVMCKMYLLSEGCRANGIMLGVRNVFEYLNDFPEKNIQMELW